MGPAGHQGARAFAVLALTVSGLPALACAPVSAWDLRAALVTEDSSWEEFSSAGARLLKESGRLQGADVALGWHCGVWTVEAGMGYAGGTRNYDGRTNTGTPLQTASAIARWTSWMQGSYEVLPSWRVGARLSGVSLARELASTPNVSGYPEYYEWRMLSVGGQLRKDTPVGRLGVSLWWGQTTYSSMRVQLPGRDVAWLELGRIEQGTLELDWRRDFGPKWSASLRLGIRWTDIGQGKPGIIRTNGVATGTAYQPRVSMTEVPLSASVNYRF